MDIITRSASHPDTEGLVAQVRDIFTARNDLSVVIAYFNAKHDPYLIQQSITAAVDCPVIMASSCKGAFLLDNEHADPQADLVVFAISDPEGAYGVGCAEVSNSGENADEAAQIALTQAIQTSGKPFETPALVWSVMPPGNEESLLEGFAQVIGPNVPVFGGSSADNEVAGNWYQASRERVGQNLVIALAMHPSTPLGFSYSSGYEPTEVELTAQACEARFIGQFDGKSAATRYNEVSNNAVAHALQGGNVLGDTTLYPLGRRIPNSVDIPEYLLSHPDAVRADGALSLFSIVEEGQTMTLMQGSIEGLVKRAAMVAKNAIDLLPEGETPAGILMIYCAGCMLTVGEAIAEMQSQVQAQFPGLPICAAYTFGEQGCFLDGKNRHGNLMISAVALAK
jgi:hypothetical protein